MPKIKYLVALSIILVVIVAMVASSSCKKEVVEETSAAVETTVADTTQASTEEVTTTVEEKEEIVLKVVWCSEADIPGAGKWFTEIAEKYNEKNPNITVEVTEHGVDQLIPAWQAAVEANTGPDVQFFWTGSWCIEYVWAGNLEDLTNWIPQEERDHWTVKDGIMYQGKEYAAPWFNFGWPAIVYNKSLFAEAGLDPENPPKDWSEFLTACEALKNSGITPLNFGLQDAWAVENIFSGFETGAINDLSEIKLAATQPGAFLEDKHKFWLERLYELYSNGYLNDDIMSLSSRLGRDRFLEGNAGFGFLLNDRFVEASEKMGGRDVVDFMPFPKMGDTAMAGREISQTQAFGIPVFSQHKEEAADFIMFMHEPENLNKLYEITHALPSDDRFDPNVLSTELEKEYYAIYSNNPAPYFGLYGPIMVWSEGVYVAGQMICSGSTVDEAAVFIEGVAEKWRNLEPENVENFINWAK